MWLVHLSWLPVLSMSSRSEKPLMVLPTLFVVPLIFGVVKVDISEKISGGVHLVVSWLLEVHLGQGNTFLFSIGKVSFSKENLIWIDGFVRTYHILVNVSIVSSSGRFVHFDTNSCHILHGFVMLDTRVVIVIGIPVERE